MSMNSKHQSGFAIIELILGIMVLGIAFVAFMNVHGNVRTKSVNVEIMSRATGLANSIMGKIRAHDFRDNSGTTALGPDEASPANYDDVDDYAGYTWTFTGYVGYSGNSRVFYLDPATSWVDSVGTATNYKRIIVSVSHGGLDSPVVLSSLVRRYRN